MEQVLIAAREWKARAGVLPLTPVRAVPEVTLLSRMREAERREAV